MDKFSVFFLFCLFLLFGFSSQKDIGEEELKSKISCDLCQFAVFSLDILAKQNKSEREIEDHFYTLCLDLKEPLLDNTVCYGIIYNTYGPLVIPLLLRSVFSPDNVCRVLGFCIDNSTQIQVAEAAKKFEGLVARTKRMHRISRQKGKHSPNFYNKDYMPKESDNRVKKEKGVTYVLHLTDPHVDLEYKYGGIVDCGEPLCCRAYKVSFPFLL